MIDARRSPASRAAWPRKRDWPRRRRARGAGTGHSATSSPVAARPPAPAGAAAHNVAVPASSTARDQHVRPAVGVQGVEARSARADTRAPRLQTHGARPGRRRFAHLQRGMAGPVLAQRWLALSRIKRPDAGRRRARAACPAAPAADRRAGRDLVAAGCSSRTLDTAPAHAARRERFGRGRRGAGIDVEVDARPPPRSWRRAACPTRRARVAASAIASPNGRLGQLRKIDRRDAGRRVARILGRRARRPSSGSTTATRLGRRRCGSQASAGRSSAAARPVGVSGSVVTRAGARPGLVRDGDSATLRRRRQVRTHGARAGRRTRTPSRRSSALRGVEDLRLPAVADPLRSETGRAAQTTPRRRARGRASSPTHGENPRHRLTVPRPSRRYCRPALTRRPAGHPRCYGRHRTRTHLGPRIGDVLGVLRRRFAVIVLARRPRRRRLASCTRHASPTSTRPRPPCCFRDSNVSQLVTGVATGTAARRSATPRTNLGLISLNTVAERTARRLGPGWTDSHGRRERRLGPERRLRPRHGHGDGRYAEEAVPWRTRTPTTFVGLRRTLARAPDRGRPGRSVLEELDNGGVRQPRRRQLRPRRDRAAAARVRRRTAPSRWRRPRSSPTSPSAPQPSRAGVLGALIGLLIGTALAFRSSLRPPVAAPARRRARVRAARPGHDRPQRRPASPARPGRRSRLADATRTSACAPAFPTCAQARSCARWPSRRPRPTAARAPSPPTSAAAAATSQVRDAADRGGHTRLEAARPARREHEGKLLPARVRRHRPSLEGSVTRVPLNGDPAHGFDALSGRVGAVAAEALLDSPRMHALPGRGRRALRPGDPRRAAGRARGRRRGAAAEHGRVVIVARLGRDSKDRAEQLAGGPQAPRRPPPGRGRPRSSRRRDGARDSGALRPADLRAVTIAAPVVAADEGGMEQVMARVASGLPSGASRSRSSRTCAS